MLRTILNATTKSRPGHPSSSLRQFSAFKPTIAFQSNNPSHTPIITVTLKNNTQYPKIAVEDVIYNLRALLETDLSTLNDFVKYCRNPDYRMLQTSEVRLKKMRLLDCTTARNVVLSSVEGTGLDIKINNPIAPEATNALRR